MRQDFYVPVVVRSSAFLLVTCSECGEQLECEFEHFEVGLFGPEEEEGITGRVVVYPCKTCKEEAENGSKS